MSGTEGAWVGPAIGAGGSLAGGAAAGKGGGGGGGLPSFYKRTAGPLATDIRFATNVKPQNYQFDENGNLLNQYRGSQYLLSQRGAASGGDVRYPTGKTKPITGNEKAIIEAMNFFSNIYKNPDINAAMGEFRGRLDRGEGGLVSDPVFNIIRERGTASAIEAGRRLGGIRESGTGRGVADFLTTAEAQQRTYEDERAAGAASNLFNMNFQRGQAGFIPIQTLGSILAGLGGGTSYGPTPQFSNAKGQAGSQAGAYLNQIKWGGGNDSYTGPPTGASGGPGS